MLDFDAKHVQGVIFLLEVPVKLLVQLTTRKHSSERKEVQRVKNIKVYISDRVLDQLSTGGGQNIFTHRTNFIHSTGPLEAKFTAQTPCFHYTGNAYLYLHAKYTILCFFGNWLGRSRKTEAYHPPRISWVDDPIVPQPSSGVVWTSFFFVSLHNFGFEGFFILLCPLQM
jgi:hypothetical protein